MAFTTVKPAGYSTLIPRASSFGENRMENTVVTTTQSASRVFFLFPIPPQCVVTDGVVKGSQPASGVSGQTIFKLGTDVTDSLFGTYTVSGGAALSTRLTVLGAITVSTCTKHAPYLQNVQVAITSGPSATTSLSLYVALVYMLPGKANSGPPAA